MLSVLISPSFYVLELQDKQRNSFKFSSVNHNVIWLLTTFITENAWNSRGNSKKIFWILENIQALIIIRNYIIISEVFGINGSALISINNEFVLKSTIFLSSKWKWVYNCKYAVTTFVHRKW